MAKLKNPLYSLLAFGQITKGLVARRRGDSVVLEAKPYPKDARTSAQLAWRTMFQLAVSQWHDLTAAEKLNWEALARPSHMTGYAYFLSKALAPNAGIYLLLTGGTMKGDIVMDSNRITALPTPGAAGDPLRKGYAEITDSEVASANKDGLVTTPCLRTLGSGSQQAAPGDHTHTLLAGVNHATIANNYPGASRTCYRTTLTVPGNGQVTLLSFNRTFAPTSLAFASGALHGNASHYSSLVLKLYMGGVLVDTSVAFGVPDFIRYVTGFRALSGNQQIKLVVKNITGSTRYLYCHGPDVYPMRAAFLSVGSVKV